MLRKHRRFAIDLEAGDGSLWVRDISWGGMRLLSDCSFAINQLVECALDTEHGPLAVQGRVVRARRSGRRLFALEYGVEFEGLDEDNRGRLRMLLDELAEQGAEQPEGPPDPLDVVQLRERLAELEGDAGEPRSGQAGAVERPAAPAPGELDSGDQGAAEEVAESGPADEAAEARRMLTRFDRQRFAHLLQLGQPMLTVADEPAAEVAGEDLVAIGAALSSFFDLDAVRQALPSKLDEAELVDRLFVYYERQLIDFA
jgi:hypothetical protein